MEGRCFVSLRESHDRYKLGKVGGRKEKEGRYHDISSSIHDDEGPLGLLKNNLMLHFAYADYEESRMRTEQCHNIYTNLLTNVPDPTLVKYSLLSLSLCLSLRLSHSLSLSLSPASFSVFLPPQPLSPTPCT